MRRQIFITEDILEIENTLKKWSGEKTSSKAFLWAIQFAHKYYPIIEKIRSEQD